MASYSKVFMFFGLVALGFLIPSEVASKVAGSIEEDIMIESFVTSPNHDAYSAKSDMLDVTIDVRMVSGDDEYMVNVYGNIIASLGEDPITLFDKTKEEKVNVTLGDFIPLDRSVVSAPTHTLLTITGDLWNHDSISYNHPIAQGSVNFVLHPGIRSQEIYGKYGEVTVQISC